MVSWICEARSVAAHLARAGDDLFADSFHVLALGLPPCLDAMLEIQVADAPDFPFVRTFRQENVGLRGDIIRELIVIEHRAARLVVDDFERPFAVAVYLAVDAVHAAAEQNAVR